MERTRANRENRNAYNRYARNSNPHPGIGVVTGIGGAGSLFCGEEYNGTVRKTVNINVDAVYGCVKNLPVAVVVSVKSREFFAVGNDFL